MEFNKQIIIPKEFIKLNLLWYYNTNEKSTYKFEEFNRNYLPIYNTKENFYKKKYI
jgi:hypothetical protein